MNNKEDLIGTLHNHYNLDIYLTPDQEQVLKMYGIEYENCQTAKELIFEIDKYLDESENVEELDIIANELAEFNYYHNTNK